MYFDDILLTRSDSAGLVKIKEYLRRHFVTKDMGKPEYFLEIELAHQKYVILLSRRKYTLDLLKETRLLGANHSTPIEANVNLWFDGSYILDDS